MNKLNNMKRGYTFDDVLLTPKHSKLNSRQSADISTVICGDRYAAPIISANMDSCTELAMAQAMQVAGGLGILHRFMSLEKQVEQVEAFYDQNDALGHQDTRIGVSIGVNGGSEKALNTWLQSPTEREFNLRRKPSLIVIDVAHGDSSQVWDMIDMYWSLVGAIPVGEDRPRLMVGNVATKSAAMKLMQKRVDAIKVGIGPGSMCTTRTVTGCGVPQLTAIADVVEAREHYREGFEAKCSWAKWSPDITIVADGGIKTSGDIVKALAIGADAVMVGGMLAGTYETPGTIITNNQKQYKVYRGMASKDAQLNREGKPIDRDKIIAEGEGKLAPIKGHVADVLHQITGGIKSGMSYCGANTLSELRDNAEFIRMTQHGMAESVPHGVKG